MKTCTGCGEAKPTTEYHRDATGRDGLRARCKSCTSARFAEKRDYHREHARAWRKANPDRAREQRQRRNEEAPHLRWEKHYRESARNHGLTPVIETFTKQELVEHLGGEFCAVCGSTENLTLDHKHPIAAGGAHRLENCQFLCSADNTRKLTRSDRGWITGVRSGVLVDPDVRKGLTTA
ncbi:HNH endonuclease signature motif containing protein [Gordonia tangerina]|uniref:HNH endonuclease n=1 Tax=Gordonia tangerina TaxID=2911060 RepID=A0ABS9DH06_9ACTN|nr:HNH endonuclease signature motif containing protein [Gordonia tangerina]MCF3938383.1 HNH endonuclease [Gordonia tangerina]